MGLYAFGMSYLSLPGFLKTTVSNFFHGPYCMFLSRVTVYMYHNLSSIMSAHLVRTIFGIPSGPGALYGFSLARLRLIWSLVIGSILHTGFSTRVGACSS